MSMTMPMTMSMNMTMNMTKTKQLKRIIILMSVCMASWPLLAQPDMNRMKRDIKIIEDVLESALSFEFKSEHQRWGSPLDISGFYLADQGIVLMVRRSHFGPMLAEMPILPDDFLSHTIPMISEHLDDIHLDVAESAIEQAQEAYEQALEAQAALAYDSEDYDEVKIKREHRIKIKEMRKQLSKIKGDLKSQHDLSEAERAELEKTLAQEQEKLNHQAQALKDEMEKIKEKQIQEYEAHNEKLEHTLIEALCDYGASLRALPSDQRISVVFSDEESFHSKSSSQVFVFNKADLNACRDGEISIEQLIEKSKNYKI